MIWKVNCRPGAPDAQASAIQHIRDLRSPVPGEEPSAGPLGRAGWVPSAYSSPMNG